MDGYSAEGLAFGRCRRIVVPFSIIRLFEAEIPETSRTHPLTPDNDFVLPLVVWTWRTKTQLLGCFADA